MREENKKLSNEKVRENHERMLPLFRRVLHDVACGMVDVHSSNVVVIHRDPPVCAN